MRLVVSRSDAANPIGNRCRQRGDVIDILEDGQDAGLIGEKTKEWWILDVPGADPADFAHLLRGSEEDDGPSRVMKLDIVRLQSRVVPEDVEYLNQHKRLQVNAATIQYATRTR